MFLDKEKYSILVYELKKKIRDDPNYVTLIQAVTLDKNKPNVGFKGCNGLFGSELWWENISNKIIKTSVISGEIIRLYEAGQENSGENNSFDLLLQDGSVFSEGIYVNEESNRRFFKIGNFVHIFYAHDERKITGANGEKSYSNTVVEMAIDELSCLK